MCAKTTYLFILTTTVVVVSQVGDQAIAQPKSLPDVTIDDLLEFRQQLEVIERRTDSWLQRRERPGGYMERIATLGGHQRRRSRRSQLIQRSILLAPASALVGYLIASAGVKTLPVPYAEYLPSGISTFLMIFAFAGFEDYWNLVFEDDVNAAINGFQAAVTSPLRQADKFLVTAHQIEPEGHAYLFFKTRYLLQQLDQVEDAIRKIRTEHVKAFQQKLYDKDARVRLRRWGFWPLVGRTERVAQNPSRDYKINDLRVQVVRTALSLAMIKVLVAVQERRMHLIEAIKLKVGYALKQAGVDGGVISDSCARPLISASVATSHGIVTRRDTATAAAATISAH